MPKREKKTLLTFYVKQDKLLKLISSKYRDVLPFCKVLGISRARFYRYTNPKVMHRIYAHMEHEHLIFKMADLLGIANENFNEIAQWADKNGIKEKPYAEREKNYE